MRFAVALSALVLAFPVVAEDLEQLMLPIAPSVVHCALESRYETRLIAYNDNEAGPARFCAEGRCRELTPYTGAEIEGDFAGGVPLPAFVYVPKEQADKLRMSILVESSELSRRDERSYTEIPVIRTSDFTSGKMTLVGLRLDPEFRQTVRMYGLDGTKWSQIMMRVYPLHSNELLHECVHTLSPITTDTTADGLQLRPSFGMECDMSDHIEAHGQRVRVELEPLTNGLKYWAFISVTNNKTQHFYTVLPR